MNIISIKDVSKKFRIYHDKPTTLKEKLLFIRKNSWEEFWALKNVNLEIKKGTTVGLIGQNGSGKSTLLKLMTKIIYPTSGEIKINGRVSSLLELGAGFHPDFTGRENIYTNASIFGLTKKEIDKRIDEIIAFSELEEFIDNPVRTYSSGMYMRLAFSVAINVDPEILLIDEILAVGDANFQKKCMDKIKEFKEKGVTIIFVTHDLGSVEKICDNVFWLDSGKIMEEGSPKEVITSYMDFMARRQEDRLNAQNEVIVNIQSKGQDMVVDNVEKKEVVTENKFRWGTREIEIYDVKMLDLDGKAKSVFYVGQRVQIQIFYRYLKPVENVVFGVGIFTQDGIQCFGTNTYIDKIKINLSDIKLQGIVKIDIDYLNLVEGTYWVDVAAHAEDGYPYDYQKKRYIFSTVSDIKDVGICRLSHNWII
jgi:ABC-type polysaccharide/polyol phosphate transport system ATPase subunit